MTDGQEYGIEIAKKMLELQQAFRAELNEHNDYYYKALLRNENDESLAAEEIAKDTSFIFDYLESEIVELAKAVLNADVYGMFYAGFVPFAKSPAEYREEERKQTNGFYRDVNKTMKEFTAKLLEWSKPITE